MIADSFYQIPFDQTWVMNDTNRLMEMGHTLLIIAFDEKLTLTRAEIYPRNGNLAATLFYVLNLYSVFETVE